MSLDLGIWAQNQGWALAGVSPARLSSETQERFLIWLRDFRGPGLEYLERRKSERLDPERYLRGAKSVLVFGHYYFPGWAKNEPKISNYAWGEDYHALLKTKLSSTAEALKKEVGDFEYQICVDTAPLLEKALATQAGLGWQGKNTLLIHPKWGSSLFLGEIITNLELELFQAPRLMSDHCGTCTRCLTACPTSALKPYVLDASRCISYWNLEHKGPLTTEAPDFHGWIAGCDICQEVCPWNSKLAPLEIREPSLDDARTKARLKISALEYLSEETWARNLQHLQNQREKTHRKESIE